MIGFTKTNTLAAEALNLKEEKKGSHKDIQRTSMLIHGLKNIKHLAAGSNHVLALDHNGDLFAWGNGEHAQLGRKTSSRHRATNLEPFQIRLRHKIKHIACGMHHSFAISDTNQVFAWGSNNFGQTGISTGAGESNALVIAPTLVEKLSSYSIRDVQGGDHHSVALTERNEVLVWGRCEDAQPCVPLEKIPKSAFIYNARDKPCILAEPTKIPGMSSSLCPLPKIEPVCLTRPGFSACFIAVGIDCSFAIDELGEVYAWGYSGNYRTGLGTEENVVEPTRIHNSAVSGEKLTFVGCGGQFSVMAGTASFQQGS